MLHGGGVSGEIFTIQTRKLIWRLRSHFDFIFLDAPWVCAPGPGILPFFADAGPFYRWARWHHSEDPNRLLNRLRETLSQPGGEWVGVLGFSQGGRLAAGLSWEQEHGEKGLDGLLPGLKFRFAVLVGSAWPLLLLEQEVPSGGLKENVEWDEKYGSSIGIPSVHMIGQKDHIAAMSDLTARCFDQGKRKILRPNTGHNMPLDEVENGELCDAVLEAYKAGGGVISDDAA